MGGCALAVVAVWRREPCKETRGKSCPPACCSPTDLPAAPPAAAPRPSQIRNPRASHTQLKARLADASVIRMGHVRQRHRTAGLEGSWVTICVIGEKSKPRETAAGEVGHGMDGGSRSGRAGACGLV